MFPIENRGFDFLRHSRWWCVLSAVVIVAGLASLVLKGGPRYGIEFRGGGLLKAALDEPPPIQKLRDEVSQGLPGAVVTAGRSEGRHSVFITAPMTDGGGDWDTTRAALVRALNEGGVPYEIRSYEAVGPQMGAGLRRQAVLAAAMASVGMLAYVGWRFELPYGAAAVAAVVHDVLVTLGLFSIANQEITLNVAAALLTLVGYSMNDTIVLFGRVRENRPLSPAGAMEDIVNASIHQTLRRTILTSGLTLLAVAALLLFGGAVLWGFALALAVGLVVGTYSSIFIACPILVWWTRYFERRKLA